MEDLTKASNDIFSKMYQNMAQQAPQGDAGANGGEQPKDDSDPEIVVE